jgi:hypothetical protein
MNIHTIWCCILLGSNICIFTAIDVVFKLDSINICILTVSAVIFQVGDTISIFTASGIVL